MARQFIGVGGTGQHVALAVSRLMFVGAIKPGDARCTIIDADDQHPLATKLQSFDKFATSDMPQFRHPFGATSPAVKFIKPFSDEALSGDKSFETMLLSGTSDPEGSDALLVRALFDSRQRQQDISKGFYANPALGATAFAQRAKDVRAQDEVASLIAECGNNDVFITGSFIGGTGAGVIPSLIQKFGPDQRLFGAFLLKWMEAVGAAGADAITDADMTQNMRHGVEHFYNAVKHKTVASALIGPPNQAPSGLVGAARHSKADETPSYYHVLAARAYYEMLMETHAPWNGTVLTFGHDMGAPGWLLDLPWHGDVSLRTRLKHAGRVADWIEGYCDPVDENSKNLASQFGILGVGTGVPGGFKASKKWAKAAHMDLPSFLAAVFEHLLRHAEALRKAVSYFDQLFGRSGEQASTAQLTAVEGVQRAWDKRIPPPPSANQHQSAVASLGDSLYGALVHYIARQP